MPQRTRCACWRWFDGDFDLHVLWEPASHITDERLYAIGTKSCEEDDSADPESAQFTQYPSKKWPIATFQ
jgi:hypothetical protein